MSQRMESYIKNMFALIYRDYPKLNLYAYDVVNEASSESGGPRTAGSDASNGQSMWVQVYGDNSFVREAFVHARKYAKPETKLFYNDYNEYIQAKRDYIANSIVKPLFQDGLLDGVGMQSHLDVRGGNDAYPSATLYGQALTIYKNISPNLIIQVTELDATVDNSNFTAQATYYRDIMNAILDKGGSSVNAVVVWGIQDTQSWRSSRNPLLFNSNGQKKAAYESVAALIPQSQWGDGNNPSCCTGGTTSTLVGQTAIRSNTPLMAVKGRTLSVNSNLDSRVGIRMVDMRGKTVAKFNAQGGSSLSLKNIPAGSYIVEAKRLTDGAKTTSAVVLR
jgi:hypothetical protein